MKLPVFYQLHSNLLIPNIQTWDDVGWLEPTSFRLTAERANQLRHGDMLHRIQRSASGVRLLGKTTFLGVFLTIHQSFK